MWKKKNYGENDTYEFYINDTLRNREKYNFPPNKINTKKYNWVTFVPHALLIQFARPANIYFLVSAILNCIPAISPISPITAILPLVFVLAVSLIREAIEDCSRQRLDHKQNTEPTMVYRDKKWEQTISGDLQIGELILVTQEQTFPADLILIDSGLNDGICFIETGSLDGEKTLKQKVSPKELANKFRDENNDPLEGFDISGQVITDPPNQDLYLLSKIMKVKFNNNPEETIPLSAKQLLLKGAKLKNTSFVIGIVVYVGHDCKIMKNAKDPVTKYSSLERLMNFGLVAIFILQAILCIIAACLRGYYYHHNNLDDVDPTGFGYTKYKYVIESFLNYFTYMLLLNTLIPISLIITLEVVKLIQGRFMTCDKYGYSHVRQRWIQPNSVSLNEECGLVKYIFSDKTGTLTCNKMQFKYSVIGDTCYQYMRGTPDETTKEDQEFREQENIIPYEKYDMYKASQGLNNNLAGSSYKGFILKSDQDPNVSLNLEDSKDLIENYWYNLALCHSCSVQINDEGQEELICVSPDSIELVKTAKAQGFHLTKSETASIKKIILGGDINNIVEVELLQLIEFSSDRKRETVIVRDRGIIKLYCKGADSIIKARTSPNTPSQILKQGEYYVDKFSKQGFRTLFVAMKVLSESEYESFAREVKEASTSLENKEELLAQAYEKVENNLYIIGATIVEDKLQDNVPETIRDLRLANIKIWMLTGDKMDTAENIAKSCNLINQEITLFRLCGNENSGFDDAITSVTDFNLRFREFKGRYNSMENPGRFAILIDEKMLARILPEDKHTGVGKVGFTTKISNKIKKAISTIQNKQENEHNDMEINEDDEEKLFMSIAKDAASVICCRVSPSQKSKVVLMMKRFYPKAVTLAIGDGGNDVPMIMEAHIGVGIYGEEGMRAVQSSDYAIGEFQFLRSLLLYHGRTNYIRNAECVIYFFYKNFCFTLLQFIFGFYCNFTGQTIIDDWFISSYNLLFTSLPLGARALLDHDVKPSDGTIVYQMLPFLYAENRDNPLFTIPKFFLHLLRGAIHCIINFFFITYLYQYDSVNDDGKMGGLWFISLNLFTSILIVVTIDLIIFTKYHTWINWSIILVFTIIAYIIFVICAHHSTMFRSVGTMATAFGSPRFWMSIIFVCGTCAMIDYFILGFDFIFRLTLGKILQRLFSQRGELNDEFNLPKCIGDRINKYKKFEQQKVHNENEINKIPQNTDVLSDNLPDENGYIGIKNISLKSPIQDNNFGVNNINMNTRENNINHFSNINSNDVTNSNMNMNVTTHLNLFNNQEEDDMDIFPNYPRPSIGKNNNLAEEFANINQF